MGSDSIDFAYDLRGRKTAMLDPDMGAWSYRYNALGELVSQTDAKGQTTAMTYDKLGRMIGRSEPDLISTWTYDTCPKGVGKLCGAASDNGYSRSHGYDALGRPSTTRTTVDTAYDSTVSFDANGRVSTQTYPTGFSVKHVYTALGYLAEVRNNTTNALYWKADTVDAEGRLTQQTYGNAITTTKIYNAASGRLTEILAGAGNAVQNLSYQYDRIGNLTARQDYALGGAGGGTPATALAESFQYDKLNRLTRHDAVSSGGAAVTTVTNLTFDALGNILYKSDVGAYTYNASGANSVRPHAVTSVAGAVNTSYAYDANGNLIAGHNRSVTYTSYNLPSRIVQGDKQLDFSYDPEHARSKQISAEGITIYLNPRYDLGLHFEKQTKPDGTTETHHYIYGGGQMIGQHTVTTPTGGGATTTKTRYFHQDHLGSIVAVTDEAGSVVERMSFDAWGKRRNLDGSAGNGIEGASTHHGYTGHEMLDAVGLVHMNGRIYDPLLGRFMSADTYVQDPFDAQSYNRYAYVRNNPLMYTDPSGNIFGLDDLFFWVAVAIFAERTNVINVETRNMVMGAAVGAYLAPFAAGGLGQSMVAGFASGVVGSGGNLQGGLQGMLSAGLFYGAGEVGVSLGEGSFGHYAAHAGAGCVGAVAAGGRCGQGAMSAVAGKFATLNTPGDWKHAGKFVAATVAGGTASVIGGGKFANGAQTAAFGYLFNCMAHDCFDKQQSFGSVLGERMNSGQVRDDISDYGVGLVEGSVSVVEGVGNSLRFIARGTGLMGTEERLRWEAEGLAVDMAAKEYATNSVVRAEVNAQAYDAITSNASAHNIGRLVGRSATGVLLAPAGALAAIGDGTRAVERVGVSGAEAVKRILFGH